MLGDDANAAGEALFLRSYSDQVWVLRHDAGIWPEAWTGTLAKAGVRVAAAPVTAVEAAADGVEVRFADGGTRRFGTLYSALGTRPQSALARALGADLAPDGRVLVDDHQACSVPGCYAAGDIVSGLNQISVAIGQAAVAATAIHNALRRRDGRCL